MGFGLGAVMAKAGHGLSLTTTILDKSSVQQKIAPTHSDIRALGYFVA